MNIAPLHRSPRRALSSVITGGALALASLFVLVPAGGCGADTAADPSVKCTPGKSVLCRCQDVESSGSKPCNDDGKSFGTCSCETPEHPAIPDNPDKPPTEVDASAEAGPSTSCGDKVVQDGEDCDDGNKVEDDGCSSACKLAGANPPATRSCPGLDTHVWSKPVTYVGSTVDAPLTGNLKPTSCKTGSGAETRGANAPDRVFKVTAHKTGTMTVTTSETNYDSLLYVTDKCVFDSIAYLACANSTTGSGGETMSFPVQSGSTYSVFVDGAGITQQAGAFRVTFAIP